MSLLRKALEGDQVTEQPSVAEVTPPASPLPEAAQPSQEKTVIMQGPLGQVYTQALAMAFSKPDPEQTQETPAETVTEIAMETQANDAIMAENALKAVTGVEADTVENPQALIYGVSAAHVDDQTVVDVASQLSQFEMDQPEEFILVVDATDMAASADDGQNPLDQDIVKEYALQVNGDVEEVNAPVISEEAQANPLIPVLESMVTRMGGRVVYSLRQAIESLDAIEPVVLDIEDELEPESVKPAKTEDKKEIGVEEVESCDAPVEPTPVESPKPIAEAGAEVTEPAVAMESNEEEEEVKRKLKELQAEIEGMSPANKDKILNSFLGMFGLATESEKGGEKGKKKPGKPESPTAKLSRASSMLMALVKEVKDTSLRSEIYHINGVINSAKKDLSSKKA